MRQYQMLCLYDQSEALVLCLLDRLRDFRAASPLTWDVHPDYQRMRRVYEQAERRTARRLRKFLTFPI